MTLAANPIVEVYSTAGGAQAAFTFGFEIFDKTHLKVKTISDLGVVRDPDNSPYVLDTDYTIPDADVNKDNGGTVTFSPAIPANYTVILWRDTAGLHASTEDWSNGGVLLAQTLNNRVDKLMAKIQEIDHILQTCIRVEIQDSLAPDNMDGQMPDKTVRASTLVGFDGSGVPTTVAVPTAVPGLGLSITNGVLEIRVNSTLGAQLDLSDPANPVWRIKQLVEGPNAFITP